MTKVVVAAHPVPTSGFEPQHWSTAIVARLGSPPPPVLPDRRFWRAIEHHAGFRTRAAWRAWRQPTPDVFVSVAEQVGFPLELLNRGRRPHITIAHNLLTGFKRRLQSTLGWLDWYEHIVVFSSVITDYLVGEVGLASDRVHTVPHPVDHRFFTPDPTVPVEPGLVVAVGREARDYHSLILAMRELPDARAVIVSHSPWAKGAATGEDVAPPVNVSFTPWLAATEIRTLMARAAVVALPLAGQPLYGAGLSALCEARAMARPVVATRTPGIADHLDPANTVAVDSGDIDGLQDAIASLLADDDRRAELGRAGRRQVEAAGTNDHLAETMAELVAATVP
ncbi:MAG: glycosyltransferase family 4 protein [Acidimicrobiia bacterium]|nr:glycosyltransferase family 4 protein [Acidimicrobiia bacterium]